MNGFQTGSRVLLLQGTHSPGMQKAPQVLAKQTVQLLYQASWAGFGGAGHQYVATAKTRMVGGVSFALH